MTEVAVLVLGSWYADGVGLLALERARLELWITHTRDMRWRGHRLCLVSGERCVVLDTCTVHQLYCGVRHSHTINPLNHCTVYIPDRPRPVKEICFSLVVWLSGTGCLKGVALLLC